MRIPRLNLSPRARRRWDRIKSKIGWYVGYPLFVLRSFFTAIAMTVVGWWRQRNLRYLLQGLPAVLMTIGVLTFGLLVYGQDRALLGTQYLIQGQQSIRDAVRHMQKGEEGKDAVKDALAMAETSYQRLVTLQDKPETKYQLAAVFEMKRQVAPMIGLMMDLAPADRTGYGPAHVAMAKMYLSEVIPPPAGLTKFRAAEGHFLRALKTKESAPEANWRLYFLYQIWNLPKSAEMHLEEAAKVVPEWRLEQARWYFKTGKMDQARLSAGSATVTFQQRLATNPDDHNSRVHLAETLMLTGDYAGALEQLRLGSVLGHSVDRLRAEYAYRGSMVCVAWYDALAKDKASPTDQFSKLEEAMKWYPNNPETLTRLMRFVRQTGPEAEKAKQAVRDMATQGEMSFLAHFALGIEAWQENKEADARHHWEKAFDLGKHSTHATMIANNLAWVIAFTPPEDPVRGLSMIEEAIKREPNDRRFRSTRGHILAQLGRYKEALPDLETARPVYPNDERLFRRLAETCTNLGMTKVAADYKKQADDIADKAKARAAILTNLTSGDGKPLEAPKDPPAGDAKPGDTAGPAGESKAPAAPPKANPPPASKDAGLGTPKGQ